MMRSLFRPSALSISLSLCARGMGTDVQHTQTDKYTLEKDIYKCGHTQLESMLRAVVVMSETILWHVK